MPPIGGPGVSRVGGEELSAGRRIAQNFSMSKTQSELTVITKAKDLCGYIMMITQKSPKHFRYTFVSRMQNLALDIIENLYLTDTGKVIRSLRRANKIKYKHRLRGLKHAFARRKIPLKDIHPVVMSYIAHLAHGHTHKLQAKVLSKFVL